MEGPQILRVESSGDQLSGARRRQYLLYAAAGGAIENRLPILGLDGSGLVLNAGDQVYYI